MPHPQRAKMSEVFKAMARTVLAVPDQAASIDAASAALLFAHVAWQRANGHRVAESDYAPVLAMMEGKNPELWQELEPGDAAALISKLMAYKRKHHPHDRRNVTLCGIVDGSIRAEWTD